ncbi:hypothetical protein K9L63_01295 [Candidatus Gracilibacteria bacterium]|nr:hypothetical protein [Candidatus Gracilibacteria bacterium]
MREIDEYLEKKGAKYFVTLTMIFYVVGTAIFNIYLRSLGISEFDLLKLRYVFIGFTFVLLSSVLPILFLLIRKWLNSRKVKKPTKRAHELFKKRFDLILWIAFVPWMVVYSLYIFPLIPSGFGGSKPVLARLIGQIDDIQGINELIAFETGVPVEKLPFERATESSELAVGANVMILDRNTDRIFLLLTKDLYLSSTSNLAKSLIESGGAKNVDTSATKNFQVKPLIVSAGKIEGITLSLYEPPEFLTAEDIEVAASALAASSGDQQKAQLVSDFISQKAPEAAPKVMAVVQQQIQKTQAKPPSSDNKPSTTPPATEPSETENGDSENIDTEDTSEEDSTRELVRAFEQIFDTEFLRFRSEIFGQASRLCDTERRSSPNMSARIELAKIISGRFLTNFPEAWKELADANYLVDGQREDDYSCTLVRLFQGAENAETVVRRFNETQPPKGPDFDEVRQGALELFNKSSQVNTAADRKYMSQVLIRHFNQKARTENLFWNSPKYMYDGKDDEAYFENMDTALNEATSWEDFRDRLTEFQIELEIQIDSSSEEGETSLPDEEPETPPSEEEPPEEEATPPEEEPTPEEETPPAEEPEEEPATEEEVPPAEEPEEETPPAEEEPPAE